MNPELLAELGLEPADDANATLAAQTHPADWQNPTPNGRYNLVVVGGGTAGLVAAAGAAGLGAKVALVERRLLGGDCLNTGCVPSKALLAAARSAAQARRAGEFGIRTGAVDVDFAAVMQRVRGIRAQISPHDSADRFRRLGVDVYFGSAAFASPGRLEVGGTTLDYRKALIATGARAELPPVPGLDALAPLTHETLFNLTRLPPRLVILGGGPIGCEMAQAFARLGSRVTLLQRAPRLLPREEPAASQALLAALRAEGVDVRLATTLERGDREPAGGLPRVWVRSTSTGTTESVVGDAFLVATGRRPQVEGLGLERVGVAVDPQRGVVVDDFLRTTHPDIFAAGDVCLATQFTHAADFAARVVLQNALFAGRRRFSALTIPWCTYTDPEVAHVGLSPLDAEARGLATAIYEREFRQVDRATAAGETAGFVRILTRRGSDRILGATLVGAHAGEWVGEIAVAMAAGLGLGRLAQVIHPYPTFAEALRQCGDAYQRTRLTPRVRRLFGHWLAWTRS